MVFKCIYYIKPHDYYYTDVLMGDLITKHNQVIRASYRLTPNEQAIVLVALSNIDNDQDVTDQVMYQLRVEELAKLTGNKSKDVYKIFKEACKTLKKRELMISNGHTDLMNWVQTVRYIDRKGLIYIRFNHDILPYLTNLKDNFTSYNLKHVAKFKSTYGVRVYELIKQWCNTKNSIDITIEELKEIFQLGDKYQRTDILKRGVIEPALKDINTHSDLKVSYQNIKTGRKVTGFKFTWEVKKTTPKITKPKEEKAVEVDTIEKDYIKEAEIYQQKEEAKKTAPRSKQAKEALKHLN